MYLSVNFLSVPYTFYPLSCTIAVKSVKSKKKTQSFWAAKNGLTHIGKPFLHQYVIRHYVPRQLS